MSKINNKYNLKSQSVTSIDEIYQKLNKRLIEDTLVQSVSQKFAALVSDTERCKFAYNLLKQNDILPFDLIKENKDNDKSTEFRNKGNEFYKARENLKALTYYNISIAYACSDSETRGLAYGNRSAVLFDLKQYNECLEDLSKAEIFNYPKNRIEKLLQRREKCLNLINNAEQIKKEEYRLELLKERNTEIPCASSAITVTYEDNLGRYIVAAENITAGEVIAVEKPFCMLLSQEKHYTHCSYCLQKSLTPIPCEYCPNIMFCNESCREEAWKSFHKIECPIFSTLLKMDFGKLLILSMRVAVVAGTKLSFEELKEIIDDVENQTQKRTTGFSKSASGDLVYDSNNYATIHALVTNSDKRTVGDLYYRAVVASVILYLLKHYTLFRDDLNKAQHFDMFAGIILRHLQTSACNMHTFTELLHGENDDEIGTGALPFNSLLNHSCSPNATRVCQYINGHSVTVTLAILPIAKGEPILDNYRYHHALTEKSVRQKELLQQYLFTCQCPACMENYPLYSDLPLLPNVPENYVKDVDFKLLLSGDYDTAKKLLPEFVKELNNIGGKKPFPNKQTCDLQEAVKQCNSILAYRPLF